MGVIDWVVIALYGAVVIGIGAWANRRQQTTEDYFLGGRRMRWWAVGISLVATSFSSAALIGGTAEGFQNGMGYLQLQLGDLLGIALAVSLFLPFFAKLQLTTAYEYLERRFGVVARVVASALFIGQTMMRAGILVLVPAVALATVLGIDIRWAIVLSGVAAVLYSVAGGIQAVVWTDLIQFAVVVFGVLCAVTIAAGDIPGGLGGIFRQADETGRLAIGDTSTDLSKPFTLLWTVFAYGTLALSIAGTGQQAVQRYLSCRDLASARRAAFLGWGIGFVAVALTLFLGVSLATWAVEAQGGEVLKGAGNDVLPLFIVHRLPAGLSGLLVAAIFAASMSSMDSAIHSMSTATLVDFVRRFRRTPLPADSELRLARVLTAVFGVAAIGMALVAAGRSESLLRTLINWLGYFAGPLLGLFSLGIFSRRATQTGALIGVTCGAALVMIAVLLDVPAKLHVQKLWLAPLALVVTVGVGWLASLLTPPPDTAQTDGMTLR